MKNKKQLFLNRQLREIDMSGAGNRKVEEIIEKDLEARLGTKVPVRITTIDEKTVEIRYYFIPKDRQGGRMVGDESLPEEYLLVFINGEWNDYEAPHTVGWAPRFGGRFQIMLAPDQIESIMKANNRDLHGSRIKSVEPKEYDDGFGVKITFG